jgi:murein L,D-transpeptidase YcbB/YkuD
MLTGRISPRAIESAWHIDPRDVDVDSAIARTLASPRLDQALRALEPQEEGYSALVNDLARYRTLAQRGGWPRLPAGVVLRAGDSSQVVRRLRDRLRAEGYAVPAPSTAPERFDAALADAVIEYQRRHGLAEDGVVGPRTLAALNVTAAHRVRQIAANLERYRWLPPDLGNRYVIVNIPAFRLAAFDHGERVLSMRVVVGSELAARHTPVFADSMSYVQFGPYWNVPRSIAVHEILPEARRDRGYLTRNDYEVVRGWGDDAPVVDPWRLSNAALSSTRYRIRQRPGPDNALGRVKFMFPNDFNVYLHDTPAQSLFDERVRAFSHGCVRVADPAGLAAFVLAGRPEWTVERIRATLDAGDRVRVDLPQKLPVYLLYLTAFDRDGEVAFREDLYDLDEPLLRAIGDPDDGAEVAPLVAAIRRAVDALAGPERAAS